MKNKYTVVTPLTRHITKLTHFPILAKEDNIWMVFLPLVKNVSRVNKDRRIEENCDIISCWKEEGSQERGRHFVSIAHKCNQLRLCGYSANASKKYQGECIEIHNLWKE